MTMNKTNKGSKKAIKNKVDILPLIAQANAEGGYYIPEPVVLKQTDSLRECISRIIKATSDTKFQTTWTNILDKLKDDKTNFQDHLLYFAHCLHSFEEEHEKVFTFCKDRFSIALTILNVGQKGDFEKP